MPIVPVWGEGPPCIPGLVRVEAAPPHTGTTIDLIRRDPTLKEIRWASLKAGAVVAIDFLDHVMNSDDVLEATAYGRVHKVTTHSVTLDWWHPIGSDHGRDLKNDTECVTLIRNTVSSIRLLDSD